MVAFKNNRLLFERAKKVLVGGVSRNNLFQKPHPFYAQYGSGSRLIDADGISRLDFANNTTSLIHGHAHPQIVEAVSNQLQKGTAYNMSTAIEVKYAELLCSRTKGFEQIRFVNSGTEAVMTMIKAARAFTGKHKIAKAEGVYHGTYDYAEVSQNAIPENWGDVQKPNSNATVLGTPNSILQDTIVFPFNDTEKTLLLLEENKDDLACILLDLAPLRIGLTTASAVFVETLFRWTRKNNVILAIDEVVSYRTNYSGAQEAYSISPDITSLGKIIGGGLPIGAIAGKKELMQVMNPNSIPTLYPQSGTFSANPISIIAGYTAMSIWDEDAISRLNILTNIAATQIEEAIRIADIPASVSKVGSLLQIHFTPTAAKNYREYTSANSNSMQTFYQHMFLEENIILLNNTCVLSTAHSRTEIDQLSEAILNGMKKIKPFLESIA